MQNTGSAILGALRASIGYARAKYPGGGIQIVLITDGQQYADDVGDAQEVIRALEADPNMTCLVCLTAGGKKTSAPILELFNSRRVERFVNPGPASADGALKQVLFSNKSGETVTLHLSWHTPQNGWQEAQWVLEPGNTSYLAVNNVRILADRVKDWGESGPKSWRKAEMNTEIDTSGTNGDTWGFTYNP